MEFGFDNEFLSGDEKPSKPAAAAGGGGWHWVLTLMSLLIVGGLSFLMAYLTKDVPERPVWMMGLIFVVPMAAMFISNLLVESVASAMTPSYVRSKQWLVALLAVLGTFLVGCICDLIYLSGFVNPARERIVFVMDTSPSVSAEDQETMQEVIEGCLVKMNPASRTAVTRFDWDNYVQTALSPLAEEGHVAALVQAARTDTPRAYSNYTAAMEAALALIQQAGDEKATEIYFVTGSADQSGLAGQDSLRQQLADAGATIVGVGVDAASETAARSGLASGTRVIALDQLQAAIGDTQPINTSKFTPSRTGGGLAAGLQQENVQAPASCTVFVLDKSSSVDSGSNQAMIDAFKASLEAMNPSDRVGVVLFNEGLYGFSDILPLSNVTHRNGMISLVSNNPPAGGTDFKVAMDKVLSMLSERGIRGAKVIFLTDGWDSDFTRHSDDVIQRCAQMDVKVYGVKLSAWETDVGSMQPVVDATGGTTVSVANTSDLVGTMVTLALRDSGGDFTQQRTKKPVADGVRGEVRMLIVMDKSAIVAAGADARAAQTVCDVLTEMSPACDVGMVLFDYELCGQAALTALSEPGHLEQLRQLANQPPRGATNYLAAMEAVLDMVEAAGGRASTRVIFMSDGEDTFGLMDPAALSARCSAGNVTVNGVAFGGAVNMGALQTLVDTTGGRTVSASQTEELIADLTAMTVVDADMLRSMDVMAKVMSGVMLLLEGLVIGVGLWLMLSLSGQFRFQVIISPVMGMLALVVLKFVGLESNTTDWWIVEGLAFSLLGMVFMVRNRIHAGAVRSAGVSENFDDFGSFGGGDFSGGSFSGEDFGNGDFSSSTFDDGGSSSSGGGFESSGGDDLGF